MSEHSDARMVAEIVGELTCYEDGMQCAEHTINAIQQIVSFAERRRSEGMIEEYHEPDCPVEKGV